MNEPPNATSTPQSHRCTSCRKPARINAACAECAGRWASNPVEAGHARGAAIRIKITGRVVHKYHTPRRP